MESGAIVGRPSDKDRSRIARLDFFLAAHNLYELGIPKNPLYTLKDEAWPLWNDALCRGSADREAFSKVSYVLGKEVRAKEEERERRARVKAEEILANWAKKYGLVDGDGVPAEWVLSYVRHLCEGWSGKLPVQSSEAPLPLSSHSTSPPPYLGVYMENPSQQAHESWKQFETRARKALKLKLRETRKMNKRTPKNAGSPIEPNLAHFEWLILYQCCGLMQKEIIELPRYVMTGTEQAISQGLNRKARLVGIGVRPKTKKRN